MRPTLPVLLCLACSPTPDWDRAEGAEATSLGGPVGGTPYALHVGRTALFAGTASGQVLRSTRGQAWEPEPALPVGSAGQPDPVTDLAESAMGLWASLPGIVWRREGSGWVVQRDGVFRGENRLRTNGERLWVFSDGSDVFMHVPGRAPARVDALRQVRDLVVRGSVIAAVQADEACTVRRSEDLGQTWRTLPVPPSCPDRLWTDGAAVWGYRLEASEIWVARDDRWESRPLPEPLLSLSGSGAAPLALTEDGTILSLSEPLWELPPTPAPVASVAGDDEATWIGTIDRGVYEGTAAGWQPGPAGLTGHQSHVLASLDGALWAAVPGSVQRWVAGAWQDRSGGLPPDVVPTALSDSWAGPVLLTAEHGPYRWIAPGWEPLDAGWPNVDAAAVLGVGLAALADGSLVATTRPAPEIARVLTLDEGPVWRDITASTGVVARDDLGAFTLHDGALLAGVRGWSLGETPDRWTGTGPGLFDAPPLPLVRDADAESSASWIVLFDIFDDDPPCERCGPARREGPGFARRVEGLPAHAQVEGIAQLDGVTLLTTGGDDPALWRWRDPNWERLDALPRPPRGPLIAHEGSLITDTLGAGLMALHPR